MMTNKFKKLRGFAALTAISLGILTSPDLGAAGLLIAEGGFGGVLEIKEHDVRVSLNNGVAVTTVTQVFQNTEDRQVEALYTFPVPRGASVSNFSMWIAGKEMIGEVLEKQRAREIYNSYKQVRRDPGLLEQVDFKSFEMRIFPIAAKAEQKVQITYCQEMEYDQDWSTYVYPLATTTKGPINQRTTGRFSVAVDVKSAIPLAAVESPSHGDNLVVVAHGENYRQASIEVKEGSLARDIVIAHRLARPQTGIDLITSAKPGEDGFFSVLLTAGEDLAQADRGSDYIFVLDISGSMRDDGKLLLSKDCLGAFINELGENDRFEVMTFNINPTLAFSDKRAANPDAKEAAIAFLAGAQANGGTILHPAITTAYKYSDPDRPLNVVILSDGLTDTGERRSLLELIQQRPRNAKVFCIGVGNDVNKPLLEQIAADSGGLASFLSRGDNFARQAKGFRRKLMNPVATDLKLQFDGVETLKVEPLQLPNLYQGAPIRMYGRYRGSGKATVRVRGSINGVPWDSTAELQFPERDDANPEIERMWAQKRIDGLIKEVDRTGSRDQALPEVISLAEQFSIVTEYTSFLVLENDAEYGRWKIERRNLDRTARDRQAQSQREAQLTRLREKALDQLRPQTVAQQQPGSGPIEVASAKPASAWRPEAPAPAQQSTASQSRNFRLPSGGGGGGSGPVGIVFVIYAAWLARRGRGGAQSRSS
jgi:Ca-activated chloride channel family protein